MNALLAKRGRTSREVLTQVRGRRASVDDLGGHGCAHSSQEGGHLEVVRREVWLGTRFGARDFERAFAKFRELYAVLPQRVLCSPDVLERYCALFEASADEAHRHSIRYEGIAMVTAVIPPGRIIFEGEVDEERMGDW